MAFYLEEDVSFFPHPLLADPDGLLCMGSSLNLDNILLAYQFGIFPWSNEGEPLLWWYTHPRCVLFPDKLKIHKSMKPYLNGNKFSVTFDTKFSEIIERCKSKKRPGQDGTWITQKIKSVFQELHEKGIAHSVEVWQNKKLVGGLYGIALGKIFFGESMFADVSNASKFGFIKLVQILKQKGFELIDCQQETQHLISLGAETISKEYFYNRLRKNIFQKTLMGTWELT